MQEMIALVASVVIGVVIILILALVQWRGQHTSIDAAQFTTAKTGMLDLVEVMEDDVTNLGSGLAVPDMRNTSPVPAGYDGSSFVSNQGGFTASSAAFDTSSTTRTVEFYALADTTTIADPLATATNTIRYSWTATGDVVQVLDPATNTYVPRPTYLLTRTVDGATAGQSMDTLTEVTFDLFDASGASTGTLADVRQVEVTLRAVSPLGGGTLGMVDTEAGVAPAVSETRWHKTFRPPNLGRKTG